MDDLTAQLVIPSATILAVAREVVQQLQVPTGSQCSDPWPEWLAVEEAARYLGISPERLRKLKERGDIPYYQEAPRCRVFFKRSELDDWMERFRHPERVTA